jgi:pheromone shutdown protein TraB
MITLIGTIHTISINRELHQIFSNIKPDLICLELDPKSYNIIQIILKHKETSLHAKDMFYAYEYSKKHQIPYAMIDKPGSFIEYQKLIPKFSIKNKIKFFFFIIAVFLFPLYFKLKHIRDITAYLNGEKNLSSFESKKYNIKRNELLKARDKHMASNLIKLSEKHKKIIALVGNAHIEGISNILKKEKIEHKPIKVKDYIKLPITLKSLDGLGLIPNITRSILPIMIIILFLLSFVSDLFINIPLGTFIPLIIIFLFWGLIITYILFERIDKWKEKKQFN